MKIKIYGKVKSFILFIVIGMIVFLSGCNLSSSKDPESKKYTATVTGYGGDVTVEVTTTKDGKIGTVKVDAPMETPDIGGVAATRVVKTIVAKQTLSVDAVSGATITCQAVLNAAETALKQAGIDTEALKDKQ